MSTRLDCHALVIGIDGYGGGISRLQSAARDATAIAEVLQTEHNYSVTCLSDEEAAGSAIERQLGEILRPKLSAESAFVLYFAGHGVAIGDGTAGPQGYLLPQDAQPSDEDSWLSMESLRLALEALPCRHLLVILDCCFAGAFRWASTRAMGSVGKRLYKSQYERYLKDDAWQALTSASHDQRAADLAPGRDNHRDTDGLEDHSPFAAALIRGLSGAADSSRGGFEADGVITATELYQYVFEELKPLSGESNQTPGIWPLRPDNKGEFIFLDPTADLNTKPDPELNDENNPWIGLEAYSKDKADLFFGRQRVIDKLLARVLDDNTSALLAVVGASGTGKSSVVKAGLLPRLVEPPEGLEERVGQWEIVRSDRLEADPMPGLTRAIKKLDAITSGGRKLLFVDQFEELYTQCRDPELRGKYLSELLDLIEEDNATTVLLTLRSDFEPQPKNNGALREIWDDSRFVVPAFSAEEFRACIEGPASVRALYFEPEKLVGELVEEVMAMPGALPMLSFTLSEMYQRARLRRRETGSTDRALTREDYEATGRIVGALHQRASALYDASTPESQASIKRVFLRLIAQDGARVTRRRISMVELEYADTDEQSRVEKIKADYIDARLLVVDTDSIEPAHDTLVVAWDKLLDWLSESGPQNLIRAVWRAATDWRQSDEDEGLSWHDDPRLPLLLAKRDELNALEQTFIDTSEAIRKKRIQRSRRIWTSVGAVILGVAAAAVWQWKVAVEQERLAEVERDQARASALLANAQVQTDPVIKGLVVSEIAVRDLPQPPRAVEVARQAFEQMGTAAGYTFRSGGVYDVRRRANSTNIIFDQIEQYRGARTLLLSNSENSEIVHFKNQPHDGVAADAFFMANGHSVSATYTDGTTVFWPDPVKSEAAVVITDRVADLATDANGTTIVIATGNEARVRHIDDETRAAETRMLGEHGAPVLSVAVDPAGTIAATGSADGEVRIWELASGNPLKRRTLAGKVTGLEIGNGAGIVAAGYGDGEVVLWRLDDDNDIAQVGQCGAEVQALTLSPGNQVLAALCDGQAWLWPKDDLTVARSYPAGDLEKLRFVLWPASFDLEGWWPGAFSYDGLWLVGGRSGGPIAWPVVTAVKPPAVAARAQKVAEGDDKAPSPVTNMGITLSVSESAEIVEFDNDGTIGRVDAVGVRIQAIPESDFQTTITLQNLSTGQGASYSIDAKLWEFPEEIELDLFSESDVILAVINGPVYWYGAFFDPKALATNARQLKTVGGLFLNKIVLSPDGRRLLTIVSRSFERSAAADPVLYDTSSMTPIRVLDTQGSVLDARFSSDGKRLVTTDCYGESRLWNADGSGDPVVINPHTKNAGEWACVPPLGAYSEPAPPRAWFSDDGNFLFTQSEDSKLTATAIGFEVLSDQIRQRTFACLTPVQRQQFLTETPETAQAGYDKCMADLGYQSP